MTAVQLPFGHQTVSLKCPSALHTPEHLMGRFMPLPAQPLYHPVHPSLSCYAFPSLPSSLSEGIQMGGAVGARHLGFCLGLITSELDGFYHFLKLSHVSCSISKIGIIK